MLQALQRSQTSRLARICILASFGTLAASLGALAAPKGSGPTQAQIDCQNRAVNDYWDNMKACEQNLSDIPDQLALCQSDAKADLNRAKSACVSAARLGGTRAPLGGSSDVLQVAPN